MSTDQLDLFGNPIQPALAKKDKARVGAKVIMPKAADEALPERGVEEVKPQEEAATPLSPLVYADEKIVVKYKLKVPKVIEIEEPVIAVKDEITSSIEEPNTILKIENAEEEKINTKKPESEIIEDELKNEAPVTAAFESQSAFEKEIEEDYVKAVEPLEVTIENNAEGLTEIEEEPVVTAFHSQEELQHEIEDFVEETSEVVDEEVTKTESEEESFKSLDEYLEHDHPAITLNNGFDATPIENAIDASLEALETLQENEEAPNLQNIEQPLQEEVIATVTEENLTQAKNDFNDETINETDEEEPIDFILPTTITTSIVLPKSFVNPNNKRGRKSYKDIDAGIDLINIPDDETLKRKLYYGITEVAGWFNVNVSQIRFWENEFDVLQPRKTKKGDRLFRVEDIKNLQLIYHLVRQKKFSIEGAKAYLKSNKHEADVNFELVQSLTKFRSFLLELKANLGT